MSAFVYALWFLWAACLAVWFILFLMFGVFSTSYEVDEERKAMIMRFLFCGLIILVLPVVGMVVNYIATNFV